MKLALVGSNILSSSRKHIKNAFLWKSYKLFGYLTAGMEAGYGDGGGECVITWLTATGNMKSYVATYK